MPENFDITLSTSRSTALQASILATDVTVISVANMTWRKKNFLGKQTVEIDGAEKHFYIFSVFNEVL